MPEINSHCKECNKEFIPKTYNQIFCSRACKSKFHGFKHKYQNVCELCGKKYNPNRRDQKYCSRYCAVRGRKGKTKRNIEEKYNTQCDECGKPFYINPYRFKKSKHHFCSYACSGNNKRQIYSGRNNPNYQNISPKICKGCGKAFFAYNKRRQYCSIECSYLYSYSITAINLKKGLEAELWCQRELESQNYSVTRSKASRGNYDIIAISKKDILLIQVKRTIDKKESRIFMKKDIEKIKNALAPNSLLIKKQIWTWIDGNGWRIMEI